jgi:hypothetical protein
MATTRCARYSDILSSGATWSLTAGTINSAFPLANLNDVRADYVAKLTGTSGTFKATIASTALRAVAVINCNRPGATITVTNNNSMASQNLVIQSASADNIGISGVLDLQGVTTAATEWSFAFPVGTGNVAVGKILLISTLRDFPIRLGAKFPETHPQISKRTSSGTPLGYPKGTRYRGVEFSLATESQRAAYAELRRGSVGPSQPCVVIPELGVVNDLLYGYFPRPAWEHSRESPLVTILNDEIEEMNPGVSLV